MNNTGTTTTKQQQQIQDGKQHCINYTDIQQAANRIQGIAHRTPVLTSTSIDQLFRRQEDDSSSSNTTTSSTATTTPTNNGRLFFKVEAMQRTGSFKFRGALNATQKLLETNNNNNIHDDDRTQTTTTTSTTTTATTTHVVTHSSGNHAAALSLAARLSSSSNHTVHATIVMPRNAPLSKVKGVKGFGGTIVTVDSTPEAREEGANRIIAETGAFFVHPSEDVGVIAGQGTVCLEFVEQVREMLLSFEEGGGGGSRDLDAVIIPVGGGGLAAGNTIALRGLLGNNVRIILAEPELMDDAKRSRESNTLLGHNSQTDLTSVADGLRTTLGPNTWPIIRDCVDDIITVTEREILFATKLIWDRLKVCIEPSAGVGVAVALGEEFRKKYRMGGNGGVQNVGVVLCGGNMDILKVTRLMEKMEEEEGQL